MRTSEQNDLEARAKRFGIALAFVGDALDTGKMLLHIDGPALSGYFVTFMHFNEEGFWEPWDTDIGRYKLKEDAMGVALGISHMHNLPLCLSHSEVPLFELALKEWERANEPHFIFWDEAVKAYRRADAFRA